jgi:hypothetical protein
MPFAGSVSVDTVAIYSGQLSSNRHVIVIHSFTVLHLERREKRYQNFGT